MTYITMEVVLDESDNGLLNVVIALVQNLADILGRLKGNEVCATYKVESEEN